MIFALLGQSMPVFWTGIMLILLFAVAWNLRTAFPITGAVLILAAVLSALLLPRRAPLVDRRPRRLNKSQEKAMKALARQVMSQLEGRRVSSDRWL